MLASLGTRQQGFVGDLWKVRRSTVDDLRQRHTLRFHRTCPLEGPNPKKGKVMVWGRRNTYAKKVVKK